MIATERPAPALTGDREQTEAEHDGSGPTRTCVGCRRRGNRSVLLRLVVDRDAGSVVVLDPGRRMPGRGAWLHPDEHCLELASRRSALARSLRRARPVDTTTVLAQLRALLQDDGQHPHDRRHTTGSTARPTQYLTDQKRQNADEHPMSTQQ